ncbi:BID domain-containing T4SS effector [Bartonella vinsonii]|uniref:protein adenylyltransferase n=1 Tax=Bartonella vinsonii subsp. berkhoffii str. Tweed TaxID=1094502 RepID=N6VKZ4_BARVB|nr:BID domain-containing T4SS effector [Bartonella vinsonii]AGF76311.1 Bep protein [Bartonella vinsonii subsp. berkhoffii str. Winnie]ENN94550.1 Bep protein [Bartonella vinsonii subsp. berkhoffii str. Tweed]
MPKAKSKISRIPSPHHYTYPGSVTLKNKYGTKNLKSFLEKCAQDSAKAMVNLREEPLPENFDSSYLKYIHKRLFENTFEWAGHTRDEAFTFSDGTTAAMPEMKRTGWENPFAIGDEIQESLQKLDQTLFEKNNLQDLTREEFISEAMEMFNSLNHTHPFRKGNGRTQRIFFENLAKAAGHQLNFSLVTKERMMLSSIAVEKEGNLEPMKHLFEDISNPEKVLLLKEFMDNMKESGRNVNDRPVMVAKEGETYTGLFRGFGVEGFAFNVKGAFIIGNKEHLTPEQLKTLKSGEMFTFTVPKTQELEKILIPEETLAPLSKNELSEKIAEDACVHTCRQQIQHLSKTVYGSSKTFNRMMVDIIKNPELGQQLSNQIERSPSSVANLVGFDLLCLKTSARVNAEEHIEVLCCAVTNFTHAVKHAQKEITQEHQAEQKRRGQKVAMPSKSLQDLLTLPKESQQEGLENNPPLQQELCTLVKNIKGRFSPAEHKAVRDGDHGTLAKSLGVSERKAQEITAIATQAKEAHQQVQTRTTYRSKALAMAS